MDDARFQCEQCTQTFGLYQHLQRHVNSKHTSVTFKCEKCTFSTNRRDNLKRHKRTKHLVTNDNAIEPMEIDREAGPSKYRCPQCEKEFLERKTLNFHIKNKHTEGEKKFKCTDCSYTTNKASHYIVHKAQHKKRKATKNITLPHPKKVKGRLESIPEPYDSSDSNDTEKSAFGKTATEKKWFIRGAKDPLAVLKDYKIKIKHSLMLSLKKHQLKYYLTIKVRFYKTDKTGNREEVTTYLNGGYHTLLRDTQFEEGFELTTEKIWKAFDAYIKQGSGWILDRVDDIIHCWKIGCGKCSK